MSARRTLIGMLMAALIAPPAFAHDGPDLTRLPLGDNYISTAPKAGWFWACRKEAGGGGAKFNGPWIKADGTYDFTAKAIVSGAVTWPSRFSISIEGAQRVFTANDLPKHATGVFPVQPSDNAYRFDPNPNRIGEHDIRLALPLNPVKLAQPVCAPGAVGILLSGAVLFSALDGEGRDAVAHEVQDGCQGHPERSGTYHYHSVTTCLGDETLPDGHSALVGYALDGFGIYGQRGEGGKILTSADLDECHGHTHKIEWNGKQVEMYHYHGTRDFPYTIGCMRGAVSFEALRAVSPSPTGARPGGGGASGPPGGRPNFAGVAAKLGVPLDQLITALGPPPPDIPGAAKKLGVNEQALREALRDALREAGGPPRPESGPQHN